MKKITKYSSVELMNVLGPTLTDLSAMAAMIQSLTSGPTTNEHAEVAMTALTNHVLMKLEEANRIVKDWADTPIAVVEYECMGCGACCTPFPGYGRVAQLSDSDIKNFNDEERTEKLVLFDGQYFTGVKKNAVGKLQCSFLEGVPGGQVKCSIYEKRPEVCRSVQNGRCVCRDARQRNSLNIIGDCDC